MHLFKDQPHYALCEYIPVNHFETVLDSSSNICAFTQHVFIKHVLCVGTLQQIKGMGMSTGY